MRPPRVHQVLFAGSLLLIAMATLTPQPPTNVMEGSALCLLCGGYGTVDALLNVGLFLPLGVSLALAGVPRGRGVLAAALLSLAIEIAQLRYIPGRNATLGDVVTNTMGAMAGLWLVHWAPVLARPPVLMARRLSIAAALWFSGLAGWSAWAMRPAPTALVYWGQITPTLGQFRRFTGTFVSGTLDSAPFPLGRMASTAAVRARLRAREIAVRATVRPESASSGKIEPIVAIFDAGQNEVMVFARHRDRLFVRLRTHAADLRLRVPAYALTGAFAVPAGADSASPVTAGADLLVTRLTLRSSGYGTERERVVRVSPWMTWSAFVPLNYEFTGWIGEGLCLLWLAVNALPLGFWSHVPRPDPATGGREERWIDRVVLGDGGTRLLRLLALLVAVGLMPLLWGYPLAPWTEWGAAMAGLAGGGALGHQAERRPRA
jgi:hypothetical protein